ncbi:MAG TPA: CoA-binding protein [Rhizomicrobium sp.]|nr:CoA-binding protein [Rhizomicrobium sp.]
MASTPKSVAAFLEGKRFAVAGVSRDPKQTANAVFRKLRDSGFEVVPVNPSAAELEGVPCYPDLKSIPGEIDGVMVVTSRSVAADIVRQCADKGVKRVWFHRSFGDGSVSREAVKECKARGIEAIVGGCPLMYCEPVDGGHACIRWVLRLLGKVPG